MLNNCGHTGHWSNRWLRSIMRTVLSLKRIWGLPLALWTGSTVYSYLGGGWYQFHFSPWCQLQQSPDISVKLHRVGPEATQHLALDLAITYHLLFCVKEKQILFPSIYANTLVQSLNIRNKRPTTRERSFQLYFSLVS